MLEFTLLGTGDVAEIPVFGCDCAVCFAAIEDPHLARLPCSAMIELLADPESENLESENSSARRVILLDAGLSDLHRRFQKGEIQAILQTHYHADHAQGMLPLRWGKGPQIPVYGPNDVQGFADLYKNPGLLTFQKPWQHGESRQISGVTITALQLIHSKPTMGYLIEYGAIKIAYLTDTVGLPAETMQYLERLWLDYLVIDCSYPPQLETPRNHNDLNMVKEITQQLNCQQVVLTHIGHELELWLQAPENQAELPNNYVVSYDNMTLRLPA